MAYDRDWAIAEAERQNLPSNYSVSFEGFGGSEAASETLVWSLLDNGLAIELRTPQRDCELEPIEIAEEYGCIAGETLDDAITNYREVFGDLA